MSDFTLACDNAFDEAPEFNTLISKFANGVEQRRATRSGSIREFVLKFYNRPIADFQTARNFFLAKVGALTSFTWTNPNDSVEYTVRFKDDKLKFVRKSYQIYDFEFTLIQVI